MADSQSASAVPSSSPSSSVVQRLFPDRHPDFMGVPLYLIDPQLHQPAIEEWEREMAEEHLGAYAVKAMGMIPALHHLLICRHIDDLLADKYDELIILAPPGSAKSSYTSHALASYYLGRHPDRNIILATHTADLSERWSRKVRTTFSSPEHQLVFPDSALSRDSTAVSRWATSKGGELLAAGVGGSILGFRADCLVGDTLLTTRTGHIRIADIKTGQEVLGYDESQLSAGYYRVVAKLEREADITYRIHTSDGGMVEATGNHKFYVGGQFVPAMALVVGDVLMRHLWEGDRQESERAGERPVAVGETVLFEKLLKFAAGACRQTVRLLRRGLSTAQKTTKLLFCCMFGKAALGEHSGNGLRAMWESFYRSHEGSTVLFGSVQEQVALGKHEVEGKPRMATWERPESLSGRQRTAIQGSSQNGDVHGQPRVRDMSFDGKLAGTPCGHGFHQQCLGEYSDIVQGLSHGAARCGQGETAEATVSRIEIVRGNKTVWDIEVEGVHTFFANGILTHNCGIIDDPISGFEQAQSITQLQKVHEWFETDFVTRLKPNAKVVLICQRLARNDLAGYLMDRNQMNPTKRQMVLTLPMLAEHDDPLGRAPGERLWPDWYTPEMVEDAKRDDFKWRTLYQQQPPSDSGAWVSPEEIRFVDIAPQSAHVYLATDIALSVNSGDYSVHMVASLTSSQDIVIVDVWRGRTSPEQTADKHIDLCEAYHPQIAGIDDDNASKVYAQLLSRMARERGVPVPWKPYPLRGQDKETRAAAIRGWFKRGKVYLVKADWNRWLVNEILQFPNALGDGVDDGVDCLSILGRMLSTMSVPAGEKPPAPPPKTWQDVTLNEMWEDKDKSLVSRRRI